MPLPHTDCDLVLDRIVDAPAASLFRAWTTPKHLLPWFCPRPYRTTACEIELWPGGRFFKQMVDPEGQPLPAEPGCILHVVPDRQLVWTSALGPGFRPLPKSAAPWFFTAVLSFDPQADGRCRYTARAVHACREEAQAHEAMGFSQGWGAVLDQLVDYVKTTPLD